MNILEVIIKRFGSSTPKFWNKVAVFGIVLTTISAGLLAAPEGIVLPEFIQKVAGYLATAGFVLTLVAKATTNDQNLSEK